MTSVCLAAALLADAAARPPDAVPPTPILVAQLRAGVEIRGVIRDVGYSVRDGRLIVSTQMGTWGLPLKAHVMSITSNPTRIDRQGLRVDPRGAVLVRLESPTRTPPDASLKATEIAKDADAVSQNPFDEVHFGLRGGRFVTARPIGGRDRSGGAWAWEVRGRDGSILQELQGAPEAIDFVADPSGTTFGIVSRDALRVYSEDGREVCAPITGRWTAAAISDGGKHVLLVESGKPAVVQVRGCGSPTEPGSLELNSPVVGVSVAPNGRAGVAWFRDGTVREIDVARVRTARSVQLRGPDVAVIRAVADDRGSVAATSRVRIADGSVRARVSRIRAGRLTWEDEFPEPMKLASGPDVLVIDDKLVVAWTSDSVRVLRTPPRGGRP